MSQSHIPQPDSNAPGEQIQSTDTVPPARSIEIPTPSQSEEISIGLGELNQIDPWFYNQFRQIAKVRWSVQDTAGKLLWYVPLNPLALDKNLAYLCRLYLGWAGDFVFNFKIAGTGFHAGLLTFVKTPPTIHPETITNPQDFTIMPWDAMDPKMLEIGSLMGRDIRPIKWHYMKKQDNLPDDYYLGGYLALFVDIPLNTSASGTPRIEIAIWAKCAPSFRVGWMVPYDLQDIMPTAIVPEALGAMLNFSNLSEYQYLSSYPIACETVLFLPAETKIINTNLYNCYMLDGSEMSRYQGADGIRNICQPWMGTITEWNEKGVALKSCNPWWQGIPAYKCPAIPALGSGVASVDHVTPGDGYLLLGEHVEGSMGATIPGVGSEAFVYPDHRDVSPSKVVDNEYKALTSEESFMVFGAGTKGYYCPQFFGLTQVFNKSKSTGIMNWISQGMAAIFQVIETSSGLPLTFAKLYRDGFFTVPATQDQKVFKFSDLELKFLFLQPANERIPANSYVTNMRMAALYHAKDLKAMRRKKKMTSLSITLSGPRSIKDTEL